MASHPTRYCSQCDHDWPQLQAYNLCPKCQRCTVAETADVMPNQLEAAKLAAKYAAFEAYLAKETDMSEFEAALDATPNIPDPPRRRYPLPKTWDHEAGRWAGDDA